MASEVAVVEREPSPLTLIQLAIQQKMDPGQLEKLIDLQERVQRNQAEQKFAEALAGFQQECPMVFKRRQVKNRDGTPRYVYASYDDIKSVTRPIESKWGISTSFDIKQGDGALIGTCRVRVGTHYEDHSFVVEIPKAGQGMNEPQTYGNTMSYLKRYLYCASLDIVVTDEDNDATDLMDLVNEVEALELQELIQEKHVEFKRFMEWASKSIGKDIEKLDQMPKGFFAKAKDMLRRKQGDNRKVGVQ
jgi:hypothetical protein